MLKRELYFDGTHFLHPKAKTAILHRLKIAHDLVHGLFDKDVLKLMALRVFRYIQESEWGQTCQCSCNLVMSSGTSLPILSATQCSGPILDLSADPGSDENVKWGLLDKHALRSRSMLRHYQAELEEIVFSRKCTFDPNVHYDVKAVIY
jgi:hypothetical protein